MIPQRKESINESSWITVSHKKKLKGTSVKANKHSMKLSESNSSVPISTRTRSGCKSDEDRRQEREEFAANPALQLPPCPRCDVLEVRMVVLENDARELKEELHQVKEELHQVKEEQSQTKTSALLRQIALDIERALKIEIIGCIPTLVPNYYDGKRRCWIDYELGKASVRDLWQKASSDVHHEVQRTLGMSLDEEMLRELQRFDFYNMKDGYNQIAQPRAQLDGNAVDNVFRVSLLDACPSDLLPNRAIVKDLVSRLLT